MKSGIHPKYTKCVVTCGCGEKFVTRSTRPTIQVEVCSKCHPFYTGKQKFLDAAGRVEKFQKKYGWNDTKAQAHAVSEADKKKTVPAKETGAGV